MSIALQIQKYKAQAGTTKPKNLSTPIVMYYVTTCGGWTLQDEKILGGMPGIFASASLNILGEAKSRLAITGYKQLNFPQLNPKMLLGNITSLNYRLPLSLAARELLYALSINQITNNSKTYDTKLEKLGSNLYFSIPMSIISLGPDVLAGLASNGRECTFKNFAMAAKRSVVLRIINAGIIPSVAAELSDIISHS